MSIGDWFKRTGGYRKLKRGLEVAPDGRYRWDRKKGKEQVEVKPKKGGK